MLASVNWSQVSLIVVVVLIVGIIALSRILMEKAIIDVSNLNSSQLFVGPVSAIAIDLQVGAMSYIKVFSKKVISI